jgi:hypothetical protein
VASLTYRTRTLIKAACGFLLITALCLAAYFGVYESGMNQKRTELEARELFHFDKENVSRLVLDKGEEHTVVERSGPDEKDRSVWKVIEPVEDVGDGVSINGLLGVLERLESERVIAGGEREPLAVYGLDKPRGRIVLTTADGRSHKLLVGKKSAFDSRLYIMREGSEDVLLVKGHVEKSLLKSTFDLRRKELVHFEKGQVRRIVLTGEGVRIELEKEEDVWSLMAPFGDKADTSEVDRILNTLSNLRATAFPAGAGPGLKSYGLEPPAVTVEVFIGPDLARQVVIVGRGTTESNQGKVFARPHPAGPVAEVREYQLKNLQKTPFDLQAKAPLEFESKRVFKIKAASDQELLVLEKRIGEAKKPRAVESWVLVSPRAAKAKNHKVNAFLSGLSGLRAVKFLGDKQKAALGTFGLDRPTRTISLYDREDRELGVLKVGKTTSEGTYVTGTARPQVCRVESRKVESFPDDAEDLEDLK